MRIRGCVAAFIIMVLVLATSSHAGVVVTNTDGSVTMIQDGRMKQAGDGREVWMIIDSDRGEIIIVNDRERTYIQTTPDEFCNTVRAEMEEAMEGIPPEQRRMMEEMGMGRMPSMKIRVEKVGSGGRIAGYSTVKYNVYRDGELYQELWLAEGTPVEKEIRRMGALMEFSKRMEECMSPLSSSGDYQALYDKGWVMRSITHYGGLPLGGQGTEKVEVKAIEVKHIPSSEFQPPEGYRRVPVRDMYRIHE